MSTYQQLPIINRLNPILKLNLETIKTKFCLYEFRIYVQKKPKDHLEKVSVTPVSFLRLRQAHVLLNRNYAKHI